MDNESANSAISIEKLVEMWNHTIDFKLSVSDLTHNVKPSLLMGALMAVLSKLGIDCEVFVTPPPEEMCDEHTEYFWDLIPIINMMRILNHVLSSVNSQTQISTNMMNLLNPSPVYTHSILLVLVNLASFYTTRSEHIQPMEQELIKHHDQVAELENERDNLLEQLNEQATDKGSRSIRLQKLEEDKRTVSDELKQQRQQHEEECRELEHVLVQNQGLQAQLDKNRLLKETLAVELARVKAQKVNDVEDINAQHEHAVQSVKEVTRELDTLKDTLLHKETSVKNLHSVKTKLDEGILHVQEIIALTDTLREAKLTTTREQSELEAAVSQQETALREAHSSHTELRSQLEELREQKLHDAAAAKQAIAQAHRAVKEAEGGVRAGAERAERAAQRLPELYAALELHSRQKRSMEQELLDVAENFGTELRKFQDLTLKESKRAVRTMEEKLGKLAR